MGYTLSNFWGTATLDKVAKTITVVGYTIPDGDTKRINSILDHTAWVILSQSNNPSKGIVSVVSNVITLEYDTNTASFANTDVIEIFLNDIMAIDPWLNTWLTTEQSPVRARRTDAEAIIASAQTLTTSFADLWPEIPCAWFNTVTLWIKCTVQQSTWIQLRCLWKHTYAGTEEMSLPIESISPAVINVAPEVVQFPDWINFLYAITAKVNNTIPYVQFQVKMSVDGGTDGTIDTANITKGY